METQLTIWDFLNITHGKKKKSWKEQYLDYLAYRDTLENHLETMCRRCINHEVCEGSGCQPKKDLYKFIMEVRLKVDKEE